MTPLNTGPQARTQGYVFRNCEEGGCTACLPHLCCPGKGLELGSSSPGQGVRVARSPKPWRCSCQMSLLRLEEINQPCTRESGLRLPGPRDANKPCGKALTEEHKFLQGKGQRGSWQQTPVLGQGAQEKEESCMSCMAELGREACLNFRFLTQQGE